VLALVSIGTSPGLPDLIGLLALSGMVVTDAIALLSLVEESRREGMDARTAVIEGGRRLRPLLTTPVVTILALIPTTLGVGGRGGFLSTSPAAIVPLPCGRLVARQRSDGRGRVTGTTRGGPVAKQAPKKPRAASKAAAKDKARTAAELERLTPRKLTREQLIEALNDDLAWEYQALIQYVQHAAAISGAQYDAIKAELIVHSNEEHAHAVSLADQIDFLGGVPGVDVYEAHISPDADKMLEQDLDGELDAITRYRERIAQAEMLQEYGLRRALEDILIIEEEHARDLQDALGL